MIVYVITNKINGKQYVGQTVQPLENRWVRHYSGKGQGCSAIKSAIKKYGKENFLVEEIYKAESLTDLNEKESEFINKFNTLAPNGYNLTTGGERPRFTEESKRKNSESQMGKIPWNKGLTATQDDRLNKQKRFGSKHHNFGKPTSEKQKSAVSSSAKKNAEKRKIKVFCHENGITYSSITEAARSLGLNTGSISSVLSGNSNRAKGYTFDKVL
jgi:group I intron endonuclease